MVFEVIKMPCKDCKKGKKCPKKKGAGFSDGLIDAYAPRADYGINWDVMKAKAARDVAHVQHGGSMHLSGGGMHPGRGADGSLQMVPDILISLQAY